MIRANFSDLGTTIGQDNVNMAYLHGLGDFFSMMFEDTSVPNLLLESDTLVASEVYSRFLQLTSTLSLKDVQTTTGSQIELLLLNSTDLLDGTATEYTLPKSFTAARYMANRPLAPTELLETEVDFRIVQGEVGSSRVIFAQPIESYALSSRLLPDGITKQYAIWLVDAHLDEKLISSYFGNLVGLSPENSTEKFANLVYGLYYVYVQGPTLGILRKSMNIVLGVPLARMNETVIDIRSYLQTDQYLIITDQNQYLVPFGLQPSVSVGDSLSVGDELSSWVEVKDYVNDGDWWVNMYIPKSLVPTSITGDGSRYAKVGSSMDYIMRNYLKTHSFLVNVKVGAFKNTQQFTELFSIIRRVKPTYTQPVYVWSVQHAEDVGLDDRVAIGLSSSEDESVGGSFKYMTRNSDTQLLRGTSRYIRYNAPTAVQPAIGMDDYQNSSGNTLQGLDVTGYSNAISNFRSNTELEYMWIGTIANRGSDTWRPSRSQVGFRRGPSAANAYGVPASVTTSGWSRLCDAFDIVPDGSRVIPLTVITQAELDLKCGLLGIDTPARYESWFVLNKPYVGNPINSGRVNNALVSGSDLSRMYPSLFRRDSELPQSKDMNTEMLRQFLPTEGSLTSSDILAGFRISCDVVSLVLLSYNTLVDAPSFFDVNDGLDDLRIDVQSPPMRGMAPHGSPFYLSRGNVDPADVGSAIHSVDINAESGFGQNSFMYRDSHNTTMPVTRGGMSINHTIETY